MRQEEIRDYLGHASVATTGRYLTTNLQKKTEAMQNFWKHSGIEPAHATPWKPKPDLLAFLQLSERCGFMRSRTGITAAPVLRGEQVAPDKTALQIMEPI